MMVVKYEKKIPEVAISMLDTLGKEDDMQWKIKKIMIGSLVVALALGVE